jgi:hypothetical protein
MNASPGRGAFGHECRSDIQTDRETIMVVNPAHRVLDDEVRKKVCFLNRKIAESGAINLDGETAPAICFCVLRRSKRVSAGRFS